MLDGNQGKIILQDMKMLSSEDMQAGKIRMVTITLSLDVMPDLTIPMEQAILSLEKFPAGIQPLEILTHFSASRQVGRTQQEPETYLLVRILVWQILPEQTML